MYQSWQEAVEREVQAPWLSLRSLSQAETVAFRFPESRRVERIAMAQRLAGTIFRRQEAMEGRVEIAAEPSTRSSSRLPCE